MGRKKRIDDGHYEVRAPRGVSLIFFALSLLYLLLIFLIVFDVIGSDDKINVCILLGILVFINVYVSINFYFPKITVRAENDFFIYRTVFFIKNKVFYKDLSGRIERKYFGNNRNSGYYVLSTDRKKYRISFAYEKNLDLFLSLLVRHNIKIS